MRLSIRLRDFETTFDREFSTLVIGRPRAGHPAPDLDLSPDLTVSRPHARLYQNGEDWWIEDLGSTHGTLLSGAEIRGLGPQRLRPGDTFQCGDTIVRPHLPPLDEEPEAVLTTERITGLSDAAALRLGQIQPDLVQLSAGGVQDDQLRAIVARIVEVVPAAKRAALLLKAREGDSLLLAAYFGHSSPAVSETLARRALEMGHAFLWSGDDNFETDHGVPKGASIARYAIASAILAPLICNGEAVGVICVDNGGNVPGTTDFGADDVKVMEIIGHHLAMALANRRLTDSLRHEAAIKANLLRQFSPQFREQLLHPGGLQLSGERGEVTILVSDIRGFESLTRHMEPIAVVEMLNDYFSRLSPIIWANNGTIDKYIGDAILAVFGSPQKDPQQHENALRAALEMQAEMTRSNAARARKGKVTCEIGIGVHCGEVLHGFIGVVDQVNLTVIGDAVNRATRYCDGAKGGEVMMSPQVYQWVWKEVEAAPAQIVTKHDEALPAFRLLGFGDPRD